MSNQKLVEFFFTLISFALDCRSPACPVSSQPPLLGSVVVVDDFVVVVILRTLKYISTFDFS